MSEVNLLTGKNILCVDDTPINLMVISSNLTKLGATVTTAASATEALVIYSDIDLVITDIMMPNVDGNELARMIKMACPNLPIIYWTASTTPVTKSLFTDKLSKPYNKGDLFNLIFKVFKFDSLYDSKYKDVCENTHEYKDSEDFSLIIEHSKTSMLSYFQILQGAIDSADMEQTHFCFHKLKGCTGMVGFYTLCALISDLEKAYKANPKSLEFSALMAYTEEATKKLLEQEEVVQASINS